MKLRSMLLLLVLVAVGGFTTLNWTTILTPTALNLGVADVQAPLGLVMLGIVIFLVAFFLIYVLYLQTTVMFDARANAKELQTNRKLADEAEASRFTELRHYLEAELTKLAESDKAVQTAVVARVEQLEKNLALAVEQSGNSVAAAVAEMDDRLKG
ncbi:MAG: Signal transduction histidine kinase [Comamonadaceae bacterium CG12_big_fil_rev_8_21_14_0_65_59_15]|nr:MAG: Signal transduction histidine kinase [Comamonadaceae bacterium CG12_big_fil_rev_8_21_14_0_65_59_15]